MEDTLGYAQQLRDFERHPIWIKLRTFMEEAAKDAETEMESNGSDDPMTYMRLQLRWQERKKVLRDIEGYFSTYYDAAKEQIEMLKMQNEMDEQLKQHSYNHSGVAE